MSAHFEILTGQCSENYIKTHDGIIIFHKKLCPHCKVMNTVLEKVAIQTPINLMSVDSEEHPDLMAKFGVERVPTIIAIRGGKERSRFIGIKNPREVIAWYMD